MPPPGKEKKRRKLDEIVLGLSAAKGVGGAGGVFASPSSRGGSGGSKASSASQQQAEASASSQNPLGLSFPRSSGITIMPCSKERDATSSKDDKVHAPFGHKQQQERGRIEKEQWRSDQLI